MSNLINRATTIEAQAQSSPIPILEVYPARPANLGQGLTVYRALPRRLRRMVGPWCFLDLFGPLNFEGGRVFDVPPHPHIGLQAVTWLFDGEVLHKDSIGSEQSIRPGELNLMTAGKGIVHSEESIQNPSRPSQSHRKSEPAFEHYAELPSVSFGSCHAVVFMGHFGTTRSSATTLSPVVGAELTATESGKADLHLDPDFEYAIFVINGRATMQEIVMQPKTLYYFGTGRIGINLEFDAGSRMILLGGLPFQEKIVMWWNFVARSSEEIMDARDDWERGTFGKIPSYNGAAMAAPPLQIRLKPPRQG
jgi:quercetin 2,3-dioxygenase